MDVTRTGTIVSMALNSKGFIKPALLGVFALVPEAGPVRPKPVPVRILIPALEVGRGSNPPAPPGGATSS